jgi:CheY-like chemotaxis protein
MQRRIQIVDNDVDVLELLESVLRSDGYDVVGRSNPEETLRDVKAKAPDLLISDVMMPAMTGIEMLKRARADGFQGRCLFISALSPKVVAEPAQGCHADAILLKPVDLGHLLATVRYLVDLPSPSFGGAAEAERAQAVAH